MASFTLNWTPAGGQTTTAQRVQRKSGGGAFATIATLGTADSSYTDTTASDNVLYTYQIVNVCTNGEVDSSDVLICNPTCPTVTEVVSGTGVELSFPSLPGNTVYTGNVTFTGGIAAQATSGNANGFNIAFTGAYGTTYTYSYTVSCGGFQISCSDTVTIADQPCLAPSNLSVMNDASFNA